MNGAPKREPGLTTTSTCKDPPEANSRGSGTQPQGTMPPSLPPQLPRGHGHTGSPQQPTCSPHCPDCHEAGVDVSPAYSVTRTHGPVTTLPQSPTGTQHLCMTTGLGWHLWDRSLTAGTLHRMWHRALSPPGQRTQRQRRGHAMPDQTPNKNSSRTVNTRISSLANTETKQDGITQVISSHPHTPNPNRDAPPGERSVPRQPRAGLVKTPANPRGHKPPPWAPPPTDSPTGTPEDTRDGGGRKMWMPGCQSLGEEGSEPGPRSAVLEHLTF